MKLKNNNLETDSPVARIEETKNNAVSESRPDNDFLARIKELNNRMGFTALGDKIRNAERKGMKEALEAVTKILDKSFIEMERELEAQIDNDVEGVFEDNPRALEILPIVHEEIKKQITAWLEELK